MPTILALAGLEKKIPETVQGQNYSAILKDKNSKQVRPEAALYINGNARGFYSGDYTFIVETNKNEMVNVFYYDNKKDPYQMTRLAPNTLPPDVEDKLKKQLVSLLKSTEDVWYKKKVAKSYLSYN